MSKQKKKQIVPKRINERKERTKQPSPNPRLIETPREKKLGYVYWANSKKIDWTDEKERRQYVITKDTGKNVGVAKIRGFDENEKSNDRLMPLNEEKYPLSKKSGVDKKLYVRKVSAKGNPSTLLRLEDRSIFSKEPSFKLSSHDTHRAIRHTGALNISKPQKGKKG